MYGLPQAGILAYNLLVKQPATSGYSPTKHTPGLFRHASRPVTLSLAVDNFGIIYVGREYADHLLLCLRELYTVTTRCDATNYCGLAIAWEFSTIMKVVLSSATEAETGTAFSNAKDGVPLRLCLAEMGHLQPPTPLQVDNNCAIGIINRTVKQRRSKALDMCFYWLQDRVDQQQFHIYWHKGSDNLADYFTKHHPPLHHHFMRSKYSLELHKKDFVSG
jgi:hypothetical protein